MKINREELLQQLQAVQPGLANKEVIEQTQSFIFKEGRVYTYNDIIAISSPSILDLDGAVKASELFQLLSKSKAKELEIETTGTELRLKTKRSKAGIRLEEVVLDVDGIAKPGKWSPLPKGFCDAVRFCLFTVSKDMTKAILTCIHVKGEWVESCDNYRFTRKPMKSAIKKSLLIPGDAARQIVSYSPTHYSVADGWLHFKNEDDVLFSCRTYEGKYPDLEELVDFEGKEVEMPDDLSDMLERAGIFSHTEFQQDEQVDLSLKENVLMVHGKGPGGWLKERVKVAYERDPVRVSVSPQFLKEMLSLTETMIIGKTMLKMETDDFVHAVRLFAGE